MCKVYQDIIEFLDNPPDNWRDNLNSLSIQAREELNPPSNERDLINFVAGIPDNYQGNLNVIKDIANSLID